MFIGLFWENYRTAGRCIILDGGNLQKQGVLTVVDSFGNVDELGDGAVFPGFLRIIPECSMSRQCAAVLFSVYRWGVDEQVFYTNIGEPFGSRGLHIARISVAVVGEELFVAVGQGSNDQGLWPMTPDLRLKLRQHQHLISLLVDGIDGDQ